MRIDSPLMTNAIATGSFTGSFVGSLAGASTTADAVEYANITSKPTIVSASVMIDHDAATNFVANEHIDHTSVTITAGTGLTGGGTIAATRTLNVASSNNGIVANANDIELAVASSTFTAGVKSKITADNVVSGSAANVLTFLNVEAAADVTDTSNVTSAGALMDSEVSALALIKGLTAAQISGSGNIRFEAIQRSNRIISS